jgi:hypothetical protein
MSPEVRGLRVRSFRIRERSERRIDPQTDFATIDDDIVIGLTQWLRLAHALLQIIA